MPPHVTRNVHLSKSKTQERGTAFGAKMLRATTLPGLLARTVGADCWCGLLLARTVGPDCWPRLLAQTVSPNCWPGLLARTIGSDCWPRLLAQTVGPEYWPRLLTRTVGPDWWPGLHVALTNWSRRPVNASTRTRSGNSSLLMGHPSFHRVANKYSYLSRIF